MTSYLATLSITTAWTALTLQNGWTAKSGTAPLSWRLIGTKAQVRGGVVPPGVLSGNTVIATLPMALWPPYPYSFMCAGLTIGGVALGCIITVGTDGTLTLNGITSLASTELTDVEYSILP